MKVDKETLIKHHFWILLIIAVILLPIVAGSVVSGVSEATTKQAQAVDSKKKELGTKSPKGNIYLEELKKQRNTLEDSKSVVWAENYEKQKGLIVWPSALARLDNLYFGDTITDEAVNTFRRREVYVDAFNSLVDRIKPTEISGGLERLTYVKWGDKTPTTEEIWLALEDLCIQRELLDCVYSVNMLLAKCEKVPGGGVEKEVEYDLQSDLREYDQRSGRQRTDTTFYRFVNPYWVLNLAMWKSPEGKSGEFVVMGRARNVSHRRLSIGRVDFQVALFDPESGTQGKWGTIGVEGDYLAVCQKNDKGQLTSPYIQIKDTIIRGTAADQNKPVIHAVQQKLDARYVPVKKVERIALSYHSHRTVDQPLVICPMSEEAKKTSAVAPDPNAAAGGTAALDKTPSGIVRTRYSTVNKQVRRMPIALVLIVDQAHIQDVLRAFANSRLRFQSTQFHCSRYRSSPSGGTPSATDDSANLVEMSLYGLVSIYEKYPPKAEAPKP